MSVRALAPYAAQESRSKGRRYDEPASKYRGEYQRDRDRIIHSTAFRRLVYKTQVFVNHEGDLYRTRLTHSLEVAQIGRSVALALGLNEPLTEAICLAHDLGHTPFGHAGQDTLNACMRDYGGFEHNLQSLRVVDELEAKYADFPGLNLMFETREGILKHCSKNKARELGDVGRRFLDRTQPSLEAQIADVADAIAYNNHDVDDGYRAGLINLEQLREQPLFEAGYLEVTSLYPSLEDRRLIYEIIRRMIDTVVSDLVENTQFSEEVAGRHLSLKRFLQEHLYSHEQKLEMTARVQVVLEKLFATFMTDPDTMPEEFASKSKAGDGAHRARVVADYIAGMTDRYAFAEHDRITG
jgi:dGTPase